MKIGYKNADMKPKLILIKAKYRSHDLDKYQFYKTDKYTSPIVKGCMSKEITTDILSLELASVHRIGIGIEGKTNRHQVMMFDA